MNRVAVLLALAACVDRGPGPQPKKIEASYIKAHLLAVPPQAIDHVDATLGGKIVYIGSTLDKAQVAPGQPAKLTSYWWVKEPPGPGWRVFTLVRGAPGSADFMNLPATDMELGHPPETWKTNEIIQDEQDFVLRPDWKSPTATITLGLIHQHGHDVGDRMAATGHDVVDRAVVARTASVDLSKAPPPPGTVYIPRAAGAIAIDGVGGDLGWSNAVTSPEFQTAEGCPDANGKASARLSWDDTYLYVFVTVTDTDVVSEYTKHDDSLWKADDIEVFIDADSNRRGYVELQVNPQNATFDSWFATTRAQPGDPTWDSNMVTAVKVRGTPAAGDSDQGWDAEIAIPWAAVKGRDDAMAVRLPPQVGDRWRMNVNRVDRSSKDQNTTVQTWNRITCSDWHATDRMLAVVFADPTGSISPKLPEITGAQGSGAGSGSAAGSAAALAPVMGSASLQTAPRAQGSAISPPPTALRVQGSASTPPPAALGSGR
ncbi:MAG: carbohydrate-binding family 9-like protein [Deltaproteobacteria bacterium]|nr:carbohydrate-binding family 9-like protein [Deltaproteobacteria bacterium]